MHYYPNEQEGLKLGIKKVTLKDVGQNQKAKSGVNANNKQGYQGNPRNLAPSETCNQWGYYPGMGNGNYYGSLNGYDYYSQQWHSSAQGFQPIPPPQVSKLKLFLILNGHNDLCSYFGILCVYPILYLFLCTGLTILVFLYHLFIL
jgi:hypothetical protein